MLKYLVILLVACRLPHVDPELRPGWAQRTTDVRVTSSCDEYGNSGTSSGVIISERHVLTAAHAVGCSTIPTVRVHLSTGRTLRVVVERDDILFGGGDDVARLEIASAERFGLTHIPPPVLDTLHGGETVCLPNGCGRLWPYDPEMIQVGSFPGDSGTAVYNVEGALIGLVVRSDGVWTRIQPLTPYWLEGT